MRIAKYDDSSFVVGCGDKSTLDYLKGVMDGRKVRMQNKIIIPRNSLSKLTELGIEYDADDEVEEEIKKVRARVYLRNKNVAKIKSSYNIPKIEQFKYKYVGPYDGLMKHQEIMHLMMVYNYSAGILGEPGTGKTLSFLTAIEMLRDMGKIKKSLIITLSPLKENILEEMVEHTPNISGVVLGGGKARISNILHKTFKVKKKNVDYDVYIANYESMFSVVELFDDDYFDLVLLDEGHRVSSPSSRQTKSILSKFENTSRKYISTGTLVSNDIMSFFMPYRFMGPDTLPISNWYAFRQEYMRSVDPDGRIWVPRAGSKKKVKDIIGKSSVLFTKDDCLDLPPLLLSKSFCNMTPEQKTIYDTLKRDLIIEIEQVCHACSEYSSCTGACTNELFAKNALVLNNKLQQVAAGFYIDSKTELDDDGKEIVTKNIIKLGKSPKIDLLMSTLDTIPDDRKIIVWSHMIPCLEMTKERLIKKYGKNRVVTCYGPKSDAYKMVQEFKKDNKKILLANPSKVGVGQNIQFSDYQIFVTNSFSYILREQAVGRQHRQGQKNKVTVIDLMCKDTVDEDVYSSLVDKKDLSINLTRLARIVSKGV